MKQYEISVDYETGNSFGSERCRDSVELKWEFLGIAKENLKRIKEHYEWYRDQRCTSWGHEKSVKRPEWLKDYKYDFQINLKMDSGQDHDYCASMWCGYFERLYGGEIRLVQDDEMSFDI